MMTPQPVSDLDIAFPSSVDKLMPSFSEIPDEFKSWHNPWNELASDWFFKGLDTKKLIPKEGIDKQIALRHLQCVIGSFEPKQEHKMAAIAYLMSQWFELAL